MDFFTGKSVFLARKLIFLTRKQLVHVHNLSACSNFFAEFFQPQNRHSPFSIWGCAKHRFHMGIPVWKRGLNFLIPVWKQGFDISIWGCVNPRFHMGIPVWKCFWQPKFLAMRWCLVRDSMAGQNYSPRFHTGSPHMETCRSTKKFPCGDSPLPKRVCDHMGINIYMFNFRQLFGRSEMEHSSKYGKQSVLNLFHMWEFVLFT